MQHGTRQSIRRNGEYFCDIRSLYIYITKMNCQECNFHMHVTYIICHVIMYNSLRIQAMQQHNVRVVSDTLLYMWLSYLCKFCTWCVINSHEQNIQFFGHIYVLMVSWLFPLFLVCFVLDLCCYLHNNLAQVFHELCANFLASIHEWIVNQECS